MALNRKRIIMPAAFLFVFVASWSGVFKFHELLTLPMIALCLLFFSILAFENIKIRRTHMLTYLIVLIVFISISLTNINAKTLNYVAVYSVFFISIYFIAEYFKLENANLVLKYNFIAVIFILLVIICEIFFPIFMGISIFDIIPRSKENTATIDGFFKRAYGFSTEPTQTGNYLVTAGLVAISVAARLDALKFSILLITYLVAVFLTFSAITVAILVLNMIILLFASLLRTKVSSQSLFKAVKLIIVLIFVLFLCFPYLNFDIIDAGIGKIAMKLALNTDNTSAMQRQDLLLLSLNLFLERPFLGQGLGYMSSNDLMSPINWYLMLLVESGMVGFLSMIALVLLLLSNLQFAQTPLLIKLGLFNGLLYFCFTSTFYSMGFWVVLLLAMSRNVNNDSRGINNDY